MGAGLGFTAPAVKENVHTLNLTFADPRHVISRNPGITLQLTGAFCCMDLGTDAGASTMDVVALLLATDAQCTLTGN